MNLEYITFLLKISLATIAGLIIGLEREFKGKEAGLKTNALVSIGSAVFVLISLQFRGEDYADVTRVLSQVVTGIGFLGAGVILKRGDSIIGLTTAATVWCSAAVGCLAAVGMYVELGFLTLVIVLINLLFGYLAPKIVTSKNK